MSFDRMMHAPLTTKRSRVTKHHDLIKATLGMQKTGARHPAAPAVQPSNSSSANHLHLAHRPGTSGLRQHDDSASHCRSVANESSNEEVV